MEKYVKLIFGTVQNIFELSDPQKSPDYSSFCVNFNLLIQCLLWCLF